MLATSARRRLPQLRNQAHLDFILNFIPLLFDHGKRLLKNSNFLLGQHILPVSNFRIRDQGFGKTPNS
ncbi:MAG: hypothetical protein R2874_00540 [Desulfobacterales bacterium]